MRFILLAALISASPLAASPLPDSSRQLVIAIADEWDSSTARMQLFQREGGTWSPASAPVSVLLGKNGLAWGRGVAGQEQAGLAKRESDARAPAGLFQIGKIYTFDPVLPGGAHYPFHQVTTADAWIDDPNNPLYNRHIVIDPADPPSWFESQKMRHNDPPHRWLIEIRHNADPPIPGAGSAIFFHIRRGPDRKTAGCTTMAEPAIVALIRWLREEDHPHYVLLPREAYLQLWKPWRLPDPSSLTGILR